MGIKSDESSRTQMRMTKRTLRRLTIAFGFPALCVASFWQNIGDSVRAEQLLLPVIIAIGVSIGIFFYAPLAKEFKSRRSVWILLIGISALAAAIAFPSLWQGDAAWAEALFLFACFVPMIHAACIRLYVPDGFRSIPDPWPAT